MERRSHILVDERVAVRRDAPKPSSVSSSHSAYSSIPIDIFAQLVKLSAYRGIFLASSSVTSTSSNSSSVPCPAAKRWIFSCVRGQRSPDVASCSAAGGDFIPQSAVRSPQEDDHLLGLGVPATGNLAQHVLQHGNQLLVRQAAGVADRVDGATAAHHVQHRVGSSWPNWSGIRSDRFAYADKRSGMLPNRSAVPDCREWSPKCSPAL